MSKSIEISQIEASLLTTYTAECDKCGNQRDEYHDAKINFSSDLHDEGWRVTDAGELHCPSCATN